MLLITLTETALHFEGLTDVEYAEIKNRFPQMQEGDFKTHSTYMIKGTAHDLYKILLNLSFTYDIEVK